MTNAVQHPGNPLGFPVRNGVPAIVLAPMEGVTDAPMRAWMSEQGGFDYCVSEFLRISQDVPGPRFFRDYVPELRHGCRTPSGTPVQVQLLGGDPEKLAEAALAAVKLGAPGIDLNFGCPAPTVNRHDGGATLLKFPGRIREIVSAVRAAVPAELPVSAKLRLGWDSLDPVHENADMAAQGGASWIAIHGRTRMAGYRPPAYWGPIGEVRRRLGLPVIANGDLWTMDDFRRCRDETGCEHYMLGRSAMADPSLAWRIREELGIGRAPEGSRDYSDDAGLWLQAIRRFVEISAPDIDHPRHMVPRVKQWIRMAHLRKPISWFDALKKLESLEEIFSLLSCKAGD